MCKWCNVSQRHQRVSARIDGEDVQRKSHLQKKNDPSKKLINKNNGIGAVYDTKYRSRFMLLALNIEIIIENAINVSVIRNISTLNILVTYYSISIVN